MMKTHDFAKALELFAALLKSGPNVEISQVELAQKASVTKPNQALAVNLATLARLSQIDKREWLDLINHYEIPLSIRPRDASRDILGKLLRYLDENPAEQNRLKKTAKFDPKKDSPELARALSFLLGDN